MSFPYPVFLDLQGVPVLVVGGGVIAFRKATALANAAKLTAANHQIPVTTKPIGPYP